MVDFAPESRFGLLSTFRASILLNSSLSTLFPAVSGGLRLSTATASATQNFAFQTVCLVHRPAMHFVLA
jgi:hypothetical protein